MKPKILGATLSTFEKIGFGYARRRTDLGFEIFFFILIKEVFGYEPALMYTEIGSVQKKNF